MNFNNGFLSQILDLLPGMVLVRNEQGQFVYLNEMTASQFGLPREQIIGKTDADFLGEEAFQRIRKSDDAVLMFEQTKYEPEREIFIKSQNRKQWMQTWKIPMVCDDSTRCVMVVSMEITKSEYMKEMLASMEVQTRSSMEATVAAQRTAELKARQIELQEQHQRELATFSYKLDLSLESLRHLFSLLKHSEDEQTQRLIESLRQAQEAGRASITNISAHELSSRNIAGGSIS